MGLLLAGVGFATSTPGALHLHLHPGAKLRPSAVVQLDDDVDREPGAALFERDREERDDDPNARETEG
ncbi:hypothetical protein NS365_13675 [Aureimonas ureilytica]|uniref:Uncharacterized protein n=1 Tax=Aureimonas ureilytica TaxID=401562 RepID=A0A175RMW8_9HYPH|nr:hypothetical protein NS226_14435 [Aureimonas ureilytica]KTR05056.1 hypothetical protein NS365_13675 [Aureimonas ureilytica]